MSKSGRLRRATKPVASRFRGEDVSSEGADWERVMHTKLAQWRYMHLVALDEFSLAEQAACKELEILSTKQEECVLQLHALEAAVKEARVIRAKESFTKRAAPAISRLENALKGAKHDHQVVCRALVASLRRMQVDGLRVESSAALARELARFRETAASFTDAADAVGVYDAMKVADALDELSKVVMTMERDALASAADAVVNAVDGVDGERTARAAVITQSRQKNASEGKSNSALVDKYIPAL